MLFVMVMGAMSAGRCVACHKKHVSVSYGICNLAYHMETSDKLRTSIKAVGQRDEILDVRTRVCINGDLSLRNV